MDSADKKIRISIVQMTSIDDVEINLLKMSELIKKSAEQNAEIVFFPENCLYMRLVEGEKIQPLELTSPAISQLSMLAKSLNIHLHLGSVPILENEKIYNASVYINSLGKAVVSYRKIHLFDIHLENQKPFRESDVFARGDKSSVLEINGFKFGQSICYDVRFSELYSQYAKQEVDAILIPAAFLQTTGEAHWCVLMRARAIESQCYVIASAQSGIHKNKGNGQRETFGHSQLVDPWGQVLNVTPKGDDIIVADLEKKKIQQVRTRIPMKSHRRL